MEICGVISSFIFIIVRPCSSCFYSYYHLVLQMGYNTLNSYCGLLVVAAGIVLFLLVEKVVRYVEDNSTGASAWSHGHHHHHHKISKKLKDASDVHDKMQSNSSKETEGNGSDEVSDNSLNADNLTQHESLLRKVS